MDDLRARHNKADKMHTPDVSTRRSGNYAGNGDQRIGVVVLSRRNVINLQEKAESKQ